jgi:hypothetical protein
MESNAVGNRVDPRVVDQNIELAVLGHDALDPSVSPAADNGLGKTDDGQSTSSGARRSLSSESSERARPRPQARSKRRRRSASGLSSNASRSPVSANCRQRSTRQSQRIRCHCRREIVVFGIAFSCTISKRSAANKARPVSMGFVDAAFPVYCERGRLHGCMADRDCPV